MTYRADEFGNLLIFDLLTDAVGPRQSRQLLVEHGGISDICWISNDVIAVGTTRGKIITFTRPDETVSHLLGALLYNTDRFLRCGFTMLAT